MSASTVVHAGESTKRGKAEIRTSRHTIRSASG